MHPDVLVRSGQGMLTVQGSADQPVLATGKTISPAQGNASVSRGLQLIYQYPFETIRGLDSLKMTDHNSTIF